MSNHEQIDTCSKCGNLIWSQPINDEYAYCECCDERICDECLKTIEVHKDNHEIFKDISQHTPEYFEEGLEDTLNICETCLIKLEEEYIRRVPLKKIPLLVNFPWETEEGTQALRNRLS
jgi:hypothetical protein